MIDIRPVGYIIGWLLGVLGASMLFPMIADIVADEGHGQEFASTAIITVVAGAVMVLACQSSYPKAMSIQQSFLLATGIWVVFPVFGALPFWFGTPHASFTDAFFEAMSGLTTTGATVFGGLDAMPAGTLLWRGMLQWFGGLGIVVVAMIFLPTLKVGGMQLFRSEGFDTMGKILPRAREIATSLTWIYVLLTFSCFMAYTWTGMKSFDALVHTMTTVSTGGMANYDASFGIYGAAPHYVASVFMLLAALPFIRFVQLASGTARPLLRDSQVQAFLAMIVVFVVVLSVWLGLRAEGPFERSFREVLFNVISIATGTGYASTDYDTWGPLAMTMFFVIGLIGGCSGSTACSVKVFRYQLLFSAMAAEVRRLHSPHRVFMARYQGRPVSREVMNSVMAFFMFFFLSLAVTAVLLVLLGVAPITAISGAAATLGNIGPGLGEEIGPAGNYAGLSDAAKWVLAIAMLVGRLEVMSVFVIFTVMFWRT